MDNLRSYHCSLSCLSALAFGARSTRRRARSRTWAGCFGSGRVAVSQSVPSVERRGIGLGMDEFTSNGVSGSDPFQERDRVQAWQVAGLERLGFDAGLAVTVVANAWLDDDQNDLVHRVEQLLHAGATHDQAARILVANW